MKLTDLQLDKIFKTALRNGGSFADLFLESTVETNIVADNNRLEKVVSGSDMGIGLRVVHNGNTAYGYTNDLNKKSIMDLADAVSETVKAKRFDLDINLSKISPTVVHKVQMRPDKISLDQKTKLVNRASKAAWGFDKKIRQASITYRDSIRKISIANSFGELTEDEKIDTAFMVVAIASDGQVMQTGYEPVGEYAGFELFDRNPPEELVKTACRRAIVMLKARPAPAGKMPVVLSSEAGGTMVHEAVGHGLEADLAIGGFSIYQNRIGKNVASPLITVVDDATLSGKRGSYSFDDEGIPAQKTVLIENGDLKGYMYNRLWAEKSGQKSTGNGRRESYKFRPSVRMTNTYIASGSVDPESIIKETSRGLFVKRIGGGQVNTMRGDFVFEVQEGYLIKNGCITDPVRGATLTGNGPDVLKTIDRVGNDIGFSIGTCGKDSQGVPVSSAQPTLRIPEMVIGGTSE